MVAQPPDERFETVVDPVDGTRWEIDRGFLDSHWRCLWGAGCLGILDHPAPQRGQGCCSVGAQLIDDDEARLIAALGMSLDPATFQFVSEAAEGGVLGPGRGATRIVDDACIFLNRPGFEGGEGCALHLAALADGESAVDWKPSICWQLPLKIDESPDGSRRLRRWRRSDWGDDDLAWCCTEDRTAEADAYDHDSGHDSDEAPVLETMAEELSAVLGREVMVELRRRRNGD